MNKRGNAETAIVLLVLAIAIIGAIFVFLPTNETTGMTLIPTEYQPGLYKLPMMQCQSQCMGRPVGEPMHAYPRQRIGGKELQDCLAKCYEESGVSQYPRTTGGITGAYGITGAFAVGGVKEYGGSIRGIALPGTRAFAGGRAYEMPKQSCYTCSCMKQGITSATTEAAVRVCSENCGGTITKSETGEC